MELTEQRLRDQTGRELKDRSLSLRVGVVAALDVAELPMLRSRLGARAAQLIRAELHKVIEGDCRPSEFYSTRSAGGFWMFLPEMGFYEADRRLRQLSDKLLEKVFDITGESLRLTAAIGYATFADATSPDELFDRAATALGYASAHPDQTPVKYSRTLEIPMAPGSPYHTRPPLTGRLWSLLQIGLILSLLVELPFMAYVLSWHAGFDLTRVTYPLTAAAIVFTTAIIWVRSFGAVARWANSLRTGVPVAPPIEPAEPAPLMTAVVTAHLPDETATLFHTLTDVLRQEYPGEIQVIVAYDSAQRLPAEDLIAELAARDPRVTTLRAGPASSKADCITAALSHVRGEFVGVFDADQHLVPDSFSRAWRQLTNNHDVVQGHRMVRNGAVSTISRLVAVEYEAGYAESPHGPAPVHEFGSFGGPNRYWRIDALRKAAGASPARGSNGGSAGNADDIAVVSDPLLVSSELAPTTLSALWTQRVRRALGVSVFDVRQLIPWLFVEVAPILGFIVWRDRGFGRPEAVVVLAVLALVCALSIGFAQAMVAFSLGDPAIRRHRSWFVLYVLHSLWFGVFESLIAGVARLREAIGEPPLRKKRQSAR